MNIDFTLIFQAIILGIIEGLTEFLPVSSTAHLLLASDILNFNTISNNLFEIFIQLGAICAIIFLYRQKISNICLKPLEKTNQKFILNITIAFLPAAIIGLFAHDFIKSTLFSNKVIAISLIIGGIIMILTERRNIKPKFTNIDNLPLKICLLIGFFQALAMVPGTSRSGATIIGALILGLNRQKAAEFSFFLAIPTIFAASFYDLYKNWQFLNFDSIILLIIGFISAFFSAILIIKWFINFISNHNFIIFGYYRILIGILVALFLI